MNETILSGHLAALLEQIRGLRIDLRNYHNALQIQENSGRDVLDAVLFDAAKLIGCDAGELLGSDRGPAHVANARMLAAWTLVRCYNWSVVRTARALSNRHPSTISHSCMVVEGWCDLLSTARDEMQRKHT